MNIDFRIINRGTVIVYYGDKKAVIQGEGNYEPLEFHVWMTSFTHWESPYENIPVTDKEKQEIMDYISSHNTNAKIIFE